MCRSEATASSISSPAALPLAHRHRDFVWFAYMCLLWMCVTDKDDMRCELDYSEGEARRVNLTLSSWPSWIQRQDSVRTSGAKPGCSGWPWPFVPCHDLHAPQHAAASPFGPLNHSNDFFHPSCRSRLYVTGTGADRRWSRLTSQEFWSRQLFRTPFLAPSPCYGGEQCDPKKVCSAAQFDCRIPHTASLLRKMTI